MVLPGNGIFVVRNALSTLITALKRGGRWSSAYQDADSDGLLKELCQLKHIINQIDDLRLIEPNVFLAPFLNAIRNEGTSGAVTSLALAAINKFLSYGLIDPTHPSLALTVENIADAVTHARFLGADHSSDAVTLMRVVEVLRTLVCNPEGNYLTNENVCEIMLSCFKICFEQRLNELLRKTSEQALRDIVFLLFMRLPQFAKTNQEFANQCKMVASSLDHASKKHRSKTSLEQGGYTLRTLNSNEKLIGPESSYPDGCESSPNLGVFRPPTLSTTPITPCANIVDLQGIIAQTPKTSSPVNCEHEEELNKALLVQNEKENISEDDELVTKKGIDDSDRNLVMREQDKMSIKESDYVNLVGIRFTQQESAETPNIIIPYGLPCIQELFRFLILLCNPFDKQNTETMIHMGLSLLTVALEVGADSIGQHQALLALVRDEMCRNLFSLLSTERLTIFATDLQVCFLLFESLRTHLKFHLEYYLTRLSEIITSENTRISYEMRELALDNLLQLWRIPGFITELYVNYDCNLYCTDVYENLTKMLAKNTLSAVNSIYSIHDLSLDALITILQLIERNCIAEKLGDARLAITNRHSRNNSDATKNVTIQVECDHNEIEHTGIEQISALLNPPNYDRKSASEDTIPNKPLADLKNKKRIVAQGTELFNQRPEKGIQYLQENGILCETLNPKEVGNFLRDNPGLDKKMIGEYISKKKNVEAKILENFVESFNFSHMRIDQALRLYLETFRLPGEAPLIFLVMEHFADHWHKCNNEPFANTDAAFRLAYAIIMLNMDQHNHNAKRLNVPMTSDDFIKNLRGLNGNEDFDPEMLLDVFNAIKNEEIVMPAEQTGIVRENYLWKVLLRRGAGKDGNYSHVNCCTYDREIFGTAWGPILSALGFVFDKSSENGCEKILSGFNKCAAITSFFSLHEDFDAIILTLCKFTTLHNVNSEFNDILVSSHFGGNRKAQAALKLAFTLVHEFGDCMRESWKTVLEIVILLFRLRLLPKSFKEVEDFCEPNGKATLILEKSSQKVESGLFSSLYSYLASDGQRQPSFEEQDLIKVAKKCINECQVEQIIYESKFLQLGSLQQFLKTIMGFMIPPSVHNSVGIPYPQDSTVFCLEIMVKVIIQNRDRIFPLWHLCRDQLYLLLIGSSSCGYEYLLNRTTIALLKLAIYLMRNEELCPPVLQSLKILLMLKPTVMFRISRQISIGIYELLKTSAQNIHTESDWQVIFNILECVGAGMVPPDYEDAPTQVGTKSDGALSSDEDCGLTDRGSISDSEVGNNKSHPNSSASTPFLSPSGENWILITKDSEILSQAQPFQTSAAGNSLIHFCKLAEHSPFALFKCWDSLEFIVRNAAHITPYSLESCIGCIRTYVEVCLNARHRKKLGHDTTNRRNKQSTHDIAKGKKREDNSDAEEDELNQRYKAFATQLLYLMYTLYTRLDKIFRWWADEGVLVPLWIRGWCPLLQGIARLAVDQRREVRILAIQYLQSALMVHDLDTLTGSEWASCFKQVIFPLLTELLPGSASSKTTGPQLLEESRVRTASIMSKVFLYHLTSLIKLEAFSELWMCILGYFEKFMTVGSDMLYDASVESLKNMLLVMHSIKVFHCEDGLVHTKLWDLTWTKISAFQPHLKDELFRSDEIQTRKKGESLQGINVENKANPTDIEKSVVDNTGLLSATPVDFATEKLSSMNQLHSSPDQCAPILFDQLSSLQHDVYQPPICFNESKSVPAERSESDSYQAEKFKFSSVLCHPECVIHNSDAQQVCTHIAHSFQVRSDYLEFSNVIEFPVTPSTSPGPVQNSFAVEEAQIEVAIEQKNFADTEVIQEQWNPANSQVPISHLMTRNEYPSVRKVPSADIVQSFAPVYVQPAVQRSGTDIYADYVKDPYNLTLQLQYNNCSSPDTGKNDKRPLLSRDADPAIFQSVD